MKGVRLFLFLITNCLRDIKTQNNPFLFFTDDKGKRQTKGLQMLLVRLLIGNAFVTGDKKNYRHPPCSVCKTTDCVSGEHAEYDSIVVEGSWLFREFVVYETNNCYPEYIITYDRL